MDSEGFEVAAAPARGKIVQELVDLRVELQRLSQLAASQEEADEQQEDTKPEISPELESHTRTSQGFSFECRAQEVEIQQLRRLLRDRDMALSRVEGALEEARRSRSALETRLERAQGEYRSAEAQLAEAGAVARELRQALPSLRTTRAFSEEPRAAAAATMRVLRGAVPDRPDVQACPAGELIKGLVDHLQGKSSPESQKRDLEDRFQPQTGRSSPGCMTPGLATPGRATPPMVSPGHCATVSLGSSVGEAAIDYLERQMLSIASQNAALEEKIMRHCGPPPPPVRSLGGSSICMADPGSTTGGSICTADTAASTPKRLEARELLGAKSPNKAVGQRLPHARRSLGDMPMGASQQVSIVGPPWEHHDSLGSSLPTAHSTSPARVSPPVFQPAERIPSRSPKKQQRWQVSGSNTPTPGGSSCSTTCTRGSAPPMPETLLGAPGMLAAACTIPAAARAITVARLTSSNTAPSPFGASRATSPVGAALGSWQPVPALPGNVSPMEPPPTLQMCMVPQQLPQQQPPPQQQQQQQQQLAPTVSVGSHVAPPHAQAPCLPLQPRNRSPSLVARSPRSTPRTLENNAPALSWASAPSRKQVPMAHLAVVPAQKGPGRPGALQQQHQLPPAPRGALCA
uniref:Uncharacterized protein n=1 Tax=Alexandrium monilatum TaxID=311494 RepID=A0A7S4QHI2_9DINO